MVILGIDPGKEMSGAVVWDHKEKTLLQSMILPNRELLDWLPTHIETCVIEDVKIHPMRTVQGYPYVPEGAGETVKMIGRIQERWFMARGTDPLMLKRAEVTKHLSANKRGRSKDSQVIEELTFRFGGKGTKKEPGPLYGIKSHAWQALALAVTLGDTVPIADF